MPATLLFVQIAFNRPNHYSPKTMADSNHKGERESVQLLFQDGLRLLRSGNAAQAAEQLSRAAENAPEDREILTMLADALIRDNRVLEALHTYNELIALGEVTAETWCAIGQALFRIGEYAQATGAYRKSLERRSHYAEAHHHLGQACFQLGDIERAMQHLELAASQSDHLSSWLALATIVPGAPSADSKKVLDVRQHFAERLESASSSRLQTKPERTASKRNKIRLGFLSAFFPRSNYMKPVWALINNHDRRHFEIHLFSDTPEEEGMEGYDRHAEDRTHHVGDLSNDALAGYITEHDIDIFIDLNAYSTPDRLALFLTPPAPICVAWFNMYATSGLPGFHYIVGDNQVVSANEEIQYSETVFRLPVSYLTFTVPHQAPPVVDPPCLRTNTITFGSLIAQYKINTEVIATWATIINKTNNSYLLIANRAMDSAENRAWVKDRFADCGVNPDRITLLGSAEHYDYLQYYDQIDIALDAFPYNGGTTTMEAIWQGVPVVTFDGDRWASRTSQTLLRRTHLGDFVAENAGDMIDTAVRLATDKGSPEKLRQLRHTMRSALQRSSACDAVTLARAMERFFESVSGR